MRGNLTLCNDRKGQQYFVHAIQKKFDEIFDIWALSVSLLLLYMQPMRHLSIYLTKEAYDYSYFCVVDPSVVGTVTG